jgi:hypothetical protein
LTTAMIVSWADKGSTVVFEVTKYVLRILVSRRALLKLADPDVAEGSENLPRVAERIDQALDVERSSLSYI